MTDFTLLSHLSTTIATVQDQSTLLKTIVAELQPVFGFYDVGLFLINEAEDYHIDLVAETPEISPSEGSYSLYDQQIHKIPHHDSPIAWVMQQITEAGQPVLLWLSGFDDSLSRLPPVGGHAADWLPRLSDHDVAGARRNDWHVLLKFLAERSFLPEQFPCFKPGRPGRHHAK